MEISLIGKRIHVPKPVSDWLEFDRAFSAKVMAGDWRNMKKEDLTYASAQVILALAVAACGLVDRGPSKPPELPAVQDSIGLINEDIAAKSPASLKKLNQVKSRSGIPCKPQLINVNSSKGAEELGICRVTNNGVEGSVIVSRETINGTEIINKPLVGYRQSDGRIIVGYQRSEVPTDVSQVMILFSDGSSQYVLENGMVIDFDVEQTKQAGFNLTDFIGQLIAPPGVAVAAEIDTPTPTATVTATAVPATPTKEAPTLVPVTEVPAQFKPAEYYINKEGAQWVDFGPGRNRWKKAPEIPVAFGGTTYEFGSIAGVVFKGTITDENGLQRALFGFTRGKDYFLFAVAVIPAGCIDDGGFAPTGFDLLKDENRVDLFPIYKGSPKPVLVNAGACEAVNNLKVAQLDYINAYFTGQKHDQAGKIFDLSGQFALSDVRK